LIATIIKQRINKYASNFSRGKKMRKQIIVLLVFFGVFLAIGCAGNNTQQPAVPAETPVGVAVTPMQTPSLPVSNATPQAASGGKIVDVSISNFAFNPATVTISTGDTVRWTNQDSATHTVKGSSFESGQLAQGDTYEFTFTEPGTYDYTCSIHPSMKGTVTVVEKK
jgi:plastocyanin